MPQICGGVRRAERGAPACAESEVEIVIAMPAFRRLCPEQLLRPGDEVEIGRVAIVFTDLQGSTRLYDALGDATAFHLVRDHFAFLSERVERHNGFVVKTVGDAVMAAFHDPADAVRAVLSIQDEVADFNRGRTDGGVILFLQPSRPQQKLRRQRHSSGK